MRKAFVRSCVLEDFLLCEIYDIFFPKNVQPVTLNSFGRQNFSLFLIKTFLSSLPKKFSSSHSSIKLDDWKKIWLFFPLYFFSFYFIFGLNHSSPQLIYWETDRKRPSMCFNNLAQYLQQKFCSRTYQCNSRQDTGCPRSFYIPRPRTPANLPVRSSYST